MTEQREWRDYSQEVRLVRWTFLRYLLLASSWVFLALGCIGIFIPGLPTTPFVLLAAGCYARSSPRFYNWLMNHRYLGPPLRQWVEHRCIPRRAKILAIFLMAATLVPTILLLIPKPSIQILMSGIGLAVALFIVRTPSSPQPSLQRNQRPMPRP